MKRLDYILHTHSNKTIMISSKLSLVLVLIILTINPTQSSSSSPSQSNPIYLTHVCPNTTTFTPNSTFNSNLHLLLSTLSSAANRTLFHTTTTGLYLCRGDTTHQQCHDCVTFATSNILTLCPNQTTAVIWFDQCMVRYSNQSPFFVQPDTFMMYNTRNVSEPKRFNQLVAQLMNQVISRASSGPGDERFATGSSVFSGFQTVYTLAQCTEDLSKEDCDRCLRTCMSFLPACCDGKMGGRVLHPSCNVRYEVYPFYNEAAPATSPSPAMDSPAPAPFPADEGSKGEHGGISSGVIVAIVAPVVVFLWIVGLGICLIFCNRRSRTTREILTQESLQDPNGGGQMMINPKEENDIPNADSLQFDFDTIEIATNCFDVDNKLGQGGFGEVYMGTLSNGEEIAVKRLSKGSGQGEEEFKNEVLLVAKLQHRNLVRLLGFCLEGDERILVYEFVPNKSLDHFLYGSCTLLDWKSRYQIIAGIARGILYLHEDSRLKIIHRDLKASNILLDKDMKAKISDFGMARIFGVDQTQANTNRIVGTYGYMSPEYAMYGQFSAKSDVYSFGVLLLEIITGLKNSTFTKKDGAQDLLGYVWRNWRDGTPLEVLDATLLDSYSNNEVMRCIFIGLVCVQENPTDRPTMATVVLMLSGYSVTHPMPKQPAFFSPTRVSSGDGGGRAMHVVAAESDQSGCKSAAWSVNEVSITDVYPR